MPDFDSNLDEATVKRPERLLNDAAATLYAGVPAVAPTLLQPGVVVAERFTLIDFIAEGGMGRVYKANQLSTGRTVALKMLPETAISFEERQRFHREAKIASTLNHQNAVSIFDFGETSDGQLFIAMEYIDGTNLSTLVHDARNLDVDTVLDIGMQICDALTEAHAHGIVHRDLKPGNIMVSDKKSRKNVVKVLDFGIAKFDDGSQTMTKTGELFGSPPYMSPEQCKGAKVTAASDIYSLGCILFESLVGTPPHKGENPMATIFKHLNDEPVGLNRARPDLKIPPDLDHLVLKCLQKTPAARYASAEEVHEELRKIQAQIARTRAPKAKPSKPLAAIIGGAALMAVLSITIGIGVTSYKAEQEKQVADEIERQKETQAALSAQTQNAKIDSNRNVLIQANQQFKQAHDQPSLYNQVAQTYKQVFDNAVADGDSETILNVGLNYAIALELSVPSRKAEAIPVLQKLYFLQKDHVSKDVELTTLQHLYDYCYATEKRSLGDDYAIQCITIAGSLNKYGQDTAQARFDLGRSLLNQGKLQQADQVLSLLRAWFDEVDKKQLMTEDLTQIRGLMLTALADLALKKHDAQGITDSITYRTQARDIFKQTRRDFVTNLDAQLARDLGEQGKASEAKEAWHEAIDYAQYEYPGEADRETKQAEHVARLTKEFQEFENRTGIKE